MDGEALSCGNFSGGLIGGKDELDEEEDAAARATRSKTCLEDWADERVVVVCFALRTRPLATPDHWVPMAVATRSGHSPRFYMKMSMLVACYE